MKKINRQIIQKPVESISYEELWFSASAANNTYNYDVNAAYKRFLKRFASKNEKPIYRLRIFYVAAAVALLLLVSTLAYFQGARQVEKRFSDIVVEAPLGAKTKLLLPDGTNVWLNAGSRIVYSQGFGMTNRKLKFNGEGYFEVKKNKELPFIVQTQDLDVTVLGTRFNFRDYPEDEEAIVNLLEGKVALDNRIENMQTQYLRPSDRMILNKKTGEMQILTAEVEKSMQWTSNGLMFDEMLLPDIVRELERSYNVKIDITNSRLDSLRFYGYFNQRKQNVYDVLEGFVQTGHLKYEEENGRIKLK